VNLARINQAIQEVSTIIENGGIKEFTYYHPTCVADWYDLTDHELSKLRSGSHDFQCVSTEQHGKRYRALRTVSVNDCNQQVCGYCGGDVETPRKRTIISSCINEPLKVVWYKKGS